MSKTETAGTAEEDEPPSGCWEVVQVFQNCIDEDDDEHLMVAVAGVECSQSIENFFWGARVPEPHGAVSGEGLLLALAKP